MNIRYVHDFAEIVVAALCTCTVTNCRCRHFTRQFFKNVNAFSFLDCSVVAFFCVEDVYRIQVPVR